MMRSLGLCASTMAVATQAILIPPSVSLESIDTGRTGISALGLVDPHTQIIKVGCAGCMFAQPVEDQEGKFIWTQGVQNDLVSCLFP